jgi:hypothetical protein
MLARNLFAGRVGAVVEPFPNSSTKSVNGGRFVAVAQPSSTVQILGKEMGIMEKRTVKYSNIPG